MKSQKPHRRNSNWNFPFKRFSFCSDRRAQNYSINSTWKLKWSKLFQQIDSLNSVEKKKRTASDFYHPI